MMSIDEAIAHEREKAKLHRDSIVPKDRYNNMPWIDSANKSHTYHAEEHEQLAAWLEDYKAIKQWKSDVMDGFCKYDANSIEELVVNVRRKVIDELTSKIDFAVNVSECIEIAEELRGGREDES